MNRKLPIREFTKDGTVVWPCPQCSHGALQLRKESLFEGETTESKVSSGDPAWEPEWIDGRFSCMMGCPHCGGQISVAGKYRVQDDRYYDEREGGGGEYQSYYRPEFFSESPPLIAVPEETPPEVLEELRGSFRLFWADPSACANRIRSSLEALLTAQRIPLTTGRIAAKGRRKFLSLHDRLVRFAAKQPELSEALMAVKWLGNAGSHSSPVTEDDIRDGFEIVELVLDKLYSRREQRVKSLSRAINRRKGPRSARRPPRAGPNDR